MGTRIVAVVVACLCSTVFAPNVLGQEGIGLPKLNPFKKEAADAPSDAGESALRLPNLPTPTLPSLPPLPSFTLPKFDLSKFSLTTKNSGGSTPSTWTKFNQGTKRLFSKTKSTLMSWTTESGTADRSSGQRVARRNSKPSIVSRLFNPDAEEDKIDSVNRYLALPRPSP